jgi:hypothetical protein
MNSLTIAWISVSDGSQPASGNSYVSPSYSVSPALAASKASISGRAAASISAWVWRATSRSEGIGSSGPTTVIVPD